MYFTFLESVEFDPWHSRKPEIDGAFALNYVGLFPAKISGFRDFISGGEGSVSTPPTYLGYYCNLT
jgi:hypothetical protein